MQSFTDKRGTIPMGLFSKPEVVFLKESNDATDYLHKLEELLPDIITTKYIKQLAYY